jgi:single-strand DNA-binding protein
MSSFNKVIVMGNLTRTPELRSTPGGAQLCDISLAVNDTYTDKQGKKQERVDFIDITFWGKQAETLARWKKKGDPLLVEGRLRLDQWEDKETRKKRSALKVTGIGFTFLGRAGGGGDAQGGSDSGSRQGGQRGAASSRGGSGQDNRAPQGSDDDGPPHSDEDYATSMPPGPEGDPPF